MIIRIFRAILIICLIIGVGFGVESASDDKVSGWAWSETIGWISFNCTDRGVCSSSNYGVNIDANGKFSGYAWSENIGWISFNESDLIGCPQGSCIARINPPGQLGKSNVDIEGWARALAYNGGWDGWIRFDHGQSDEPYIDSDGNWYGWAWASDVVGWISFNCGDRGVCGTSNYKVVTSDINNPPTATNLSKTDPDWCACPPSYFFSWTYSDPNDDNETRFDFQIDNNSNFSSPEIDRSYTDLSYPSPSQNTQSVLVAVSSLQDYLIYNQTYYWRVKVYDSKGADSGWVSGSLFSTETHHYPDIDFTWIPTNPNPEEEVQFTDQSNCYDDNSNGGSCNENDSYSWTFQDADPDSSIIKNPLTTFQDPGAKQVNLSVTDSDNYTCSFTKTVQVSLALPKWKEIKPW